MSRLRVAAALAVLFMGLGVGPSRVTPTAAAPAPAAVVRSAVAFTVSNPADPGHLYTVGGRWSVPRAAPARCSSPSTA